VALYVRGGQVVAHDGILGEVPLEERVLDGVLLLEEPIHRTVGSVGAGVGDAEVHAERGVSEPRDRGGLGGAREHLGNDEPEHTGAPLAGRAEQLLESKAPCEADDDGTVPVARPAGDPKRVASRHERFTAQDLADCLEGCRWQMREVGKRLVLDLAVLAVGAPEGGSPMPLPCPCRPSWWSRHAWLRHYALACGGTATHRAAVRGSSAYASRCIARVAARQQP